MKALEQYVESMNSWNAIFNTAAMTFPLSQTNVRDIAGKIEGELSPENLHCDGEASLAHVRKQSAMLHRTLNDLEAYCQRNGLDFPKLYI